MEMKYEVDGKTPYRLQDKEKNANVSGNRKWLLICD